MTAHTVIPATEIWDLPFWSSYAGVGEFTGRQLHAADACTPGEFAGQRVVVGGGNSAAQILAEVFVRSPTPPG